MPRPLLLLSWLARLPKAPLSAALRQGLPKQNAAWPSGTHSADVKDAGWLWLAAGSLRGESGSRRPFFCGSYSASSVIQFPLPQTGEGIAECEVLKWYVKEGGAVEKFGMLCEVQSDKATIQITSPHDGRILKVHHQEGDVVKVGNTLVDIEVDGTEVTATQSLTKDAHQDSEEEGRSQSNTPTPKDRAPVHSTPAVRHLAKTEGVDISEVTPTGPKGRVTKEDVLRHIQSRKGGAATEPPTAAIEHPDPSASEHDLDAPICKPILGYHRAMVKSMTQAATIPHLHFCEEINVNALVDIKKKLINSADIEGVKLTYLPFILKTLSTAAHKFPSLNASLSSDLTQMILHRRHNFGVAMATPVGLVVPVVKDIQSKNIVSIALELQRLQKLAVEGKLTITDISEATLSISNIGPIGGTYAAPLVTPPQVAIVALGQIRKLPRFDSKGDVVRHSVMPVSWGADHRAVDGATVAEFCMEWKRCLEEPERLLLHLR
eukprot:evm.model.scf_437EXC.1 EVM.evm.TU.scf_437EXC.1   scf_437EXC:1447-5279(+)